MTMLDYRIMAYNPADHKSGAWIVEEVETLDLAVADLDRRINRAPHLCFLLYCEESRKFVACKWTNRPMMWFEGSLTYDQDYDRSKWILTTEQARRVPRFRR
jgi:hypothetical protein